MRSIHRKKSMKVVTHADFQEVYTKEPAAAPGRIEAILKAIDSEVPLVEAEPAGWDDIEAIHTTGHVDSVTRRGLYKIAALAAGAAIQAALTGLEEPCFALVRPPGHHASAGSSWGFCYFNNMAIAIDHLHRTGRIKTAYVLDFDLHYGDGTVSILRPKGYVAIHNPEAEHRLVYLKSVAEQLATAQADIIGVSAGFDNHLLDWGQLLSTRDYQAMGRMVWETCQRLGVGCFAVLEGGYNHQVLGECVQAFLLGLQGR
jgi:acetoin utilization deacetylase AcuC-like enzyme